MAESSIWEQIKASMDSILQVGAWLVGVIVMFVISPPRLTSADDSQFFVRAAQFVVAILLVLVIVAVRRSGWTVRKLWISTVGALLAAVAAFFAYLFFYLSKTCEYDGRGPMVIGNTMSPGAREYAASDPPKDCRTMLWDYAGNTGEIWPRGELLVNYLAISASFIATVCLFAVTLVLAIELVKKTRAV